MDFASVFVVLFDVLTVLTFSFVDVFSFSDALFALVLVSSGVAFVLSDFESLSSFVLSFGFCLVSCFV